MSTSLFDLNHEQAARLAAADCDDFSNSPNHRLTIPKTDTYVVLPSAFCPLRSLQQHGYMDWVITGTYDVVNGPNTPTINFRPSIATAAATGLAGATANGFAFTPGAQSVASYFFMFECRMAVVGEGGAISTSLAKQLWRATFSLIATDTLAPLYTVTQFIDTEISSAIDRLLDFAVKLPSDANGPTIVVKSVTCIHVGARSGI